MLYLRFVLSIFMKCMPIVTEKLHGGQPEMNLNVYSCICNMCSAVAIKTLEFHK